jgi:transposase
MAKLVHDIKLIPAQHVTPFVRGDKNDHNDALAITEESTPVYPLCAD